MGEVEVAVGCPHRLRQPIGSRTRYPCEHCAPFGPPGWPRWAIAMTVDYGPRLSAAATVAPRVPPPPPKPNPDVLARLTDMTRAFTEGMERAAERLRPVMREFVEATRGIHIEPLRIEVSPVDRVTNTVTVRARTEVLSEVQRRIRLNIGE